MRRAAWTIYAANDCNRAEYLIRTLLCAWSSFYLSKSPRNERVWLTMALFKGYQKPVNYLTETALLRRNKRSFYTTKALSFWLFLKTMFITRPWYRFPHPMAQDNEVWAPVQAQMTTQTRPKTKTDSPTFTERAQIGNEHSLKKMKHTSRNFYQRFRLIGHAKYAMRLDNDFFTP